MNPPPKVSVILTSYNHAKYLHDAIDSVLAQTFSDFELIIWDDASADASWEIINDYSDSRIRAFRNETNLRFGNVNRALEQAVGEYIAIHHSDDVWEQQKLEKQVAFLDAHSEIGAVFTWAQIIDENGDNLPEEWFIQENKSQWLWLRQLFQGENHLNHPSILIRRVCYQKVGPYRFGLAQTGDAEMWTRLLLKYPIHVIQERLTKHRLMSDKSNTSGTRSDAKIRMQYEFYKLLQNYRRITSFDDLKAIFPSAEKYDRKEQSDIDFALAMMALEEGTSPSIQLFGLDILFEIISDLERFTKIKNLYDFDYKTFIALTGKYDVFSRDVLSVLQEAVVERDEKIAVLSVLSIKQEQSLQSLYSQIIEKEQALQALSSQAVEKEQALQALSSQAVEKEQTLQALSLQNRNYERELTQIKNSKTWKIVLLRRQISRFIASPLKRANQNLEADVDLVRSSDLFDELWYLANNPDVANVDIDPAVHYVRFGGFESRDPGPRFCSASYLAAYKDVKKAGVNPLVHFLKYGRRENRSTQPILPAQPIEKVQEHEKEQEHVDIASEKDEPVRYKPPLDESFLADGERKRNNKDSNKQGLKIVLAVHQFVPDYSSGTEILTYETAKALQKQGHEVIVFTGYPAQGELKDAKRFDRYEYDGIRIERFHHSYTPMGDQTNTLEMEYDNRLFGSYFREFLKYEKPDLVHFFHLSRLSASPIDVCNELNIPTLLTPTDFWFICHTSHLRLPNDQACLGPDKSGVNCLRHVLVVHRLTRINAIMQKLPDWLIAPLIFLIKHGVNFDKKYSPYVRALVNRREFLGQRLNRVDKIIVPTKVMMDSLTHNGLEIQRAISLPYGLNLSYLENAKRPEPGGVLRLGYIGTLYEHKGVHILVEAVKKLNGRPVELYIYGNLNDFPHYVESLRRIAQDDLRIKFCGTFPNTEIGSIFSGLDALVVPSLWHENAPLVIYSAQAAKCPVIASNMAGMSEVIEHNKNGLLFEAGNVDDLVKNIEALLDDDRLLQKLSDNARKPLSIQEYALKLSEIYQNIIKKEKSI